MKEQEELSIPERISALNRRIKMKKKYQVAFSILFLSASLVGCGDSNTDSANEAGNNVEEIAEATQNEEVQAEEETNKNEEKIRFVTKSIDDLYNFDHTSYDVRNDKIQENFTIERVNAITSLETLDSAIDFVSTVEITEVYQDIANENKFAVEGKMSFQVEDNEATIFRNILTLTIEERDGQYLISEMEMVPIQNPSMIP